MSFIRPEFSKHSVEPIGADIPQPVSLSVDRGLDADDSVPVKAASSRGTRVGEIVLAGLTADHGANQRGVSKAERNGSPGSLGIRLTMVV
jgi:hypothetical protein